MKLFFGLDVSRAKTSACEVAHHFGQVCGKSRLYRV